MWTQLPPERETVPQFSAHVYCGQTCACIKMKLGVELGLGPGNIVSDGDPAPTPPKGHSSQIFSKCLLWQNVWLDQAATYYRGRPQPSKHCIRRGPSSPPPEGHNRQFVAHVCCGQMAPWIKMPRGREVGLGPGNIAIDTDSAHHLRRDIAAPQFSAHVCCGGQTSTSVAPCFVTAPMSLNGGQHNLGGCLASSGLVHYIYILGALPP